MGSEQSVPSSSSSPPPPPLSYDYQARFTNTNTQSSNPGSEWKKLSSVQTFALPKTVVQGDNQPLSSPDAVRFCAISDTHGLHDKPVSVIKDELPVADVLLHAGDFTDKGTHKDLEKFLDFLEECSKHFEEVIFIAGNNDITLDTVFYEKEWSRFHKMRVDAVETKEWFLGQIRERCPNVHYLEDQVHVTVGGVVVYGSPWQPTFHKWAFNLDRGEPCLSAWEKIPTNTDVLLTHGPPLGRGDKCHPFGVRAGCLDLLHQIQNRIKPKVHVFGHIHEGFGKFAICSLF